MNKKLLRALLNEVVSGDLKSSEKGVWDNIFMQSTIFIRAHAQDNWVEMGIARQWLWDAIVAGKNEGILKAKDVKFLDALMDKDQNFPFDNVLKIAEYFSKRWRAMFVGMYRTKEHAGFGDTRERDPEGFDPDVFVGDYEED